MSQSSRDSEVSAATEQRLILQVKKKGKSQKSRALRAFEYCAKRIERELVRPSLLTFAFCLFTLKIVRHSKIIALFVLPSMLGGVMWQAVRERDRRIASQEILERLKDFGTPAPLRIDDLLSRGADVNIADSQGRTPLHLAISRGDADDLVRPLLARGADINARSNEPFSPRATPLYLAVTMAKVEVVRLLLSRGARVNLDIAPPNRHGTVLTWLEWDIQHPQLHFGRLGTPCQYRQILSLLRAASDQENRIVS